MPIDIRSRIKGMICGLAIADAAGVSNEFAKSPIDAIYPCKEAKKDSELNDWTDGADFAIITMESMMECSASNIDIINLAKRLRDWSRVGFAEIGDSAPQKYSKSLSVVIEHKDFITNPINASQDIWNKSNKCFATNAALLRIPPIACMQTYDDALKGAIMASLITHTDARCTATAVFYMLVLHIILHCDGEIDILNEEMIKNMMDKGSAAAKKYLPKDGFAEFDKYIKMGFDGKIEAIELQDMTRPDYIYKSLALICYCLKVISVGIRSGKNISFRKCIARVAKCCGLSTTNCAIAGSIIGAYKAFENLPGKWLEAAPHYDWLLSRTEMFTKFVLKELVVSNSEIPEIIESQTPIAEAQDAPTANTSNFESSESPESPNASKAPKQETQYVPKRRVGRPKRVTVDQ